MYNQRKAAQVAAHFIVMAGGQLNVLKLTKLLYLADRTMLDQFEYSLTGDNLVSMPHGPVLSQTLDCTKGRFEKIPDGWENWIAPPAHHNVTLARTTPLRDDLDLLSDAEIEVIDAVWVQYGHMDKYSIRNFTHDNCPEWEDPKKSSLPIPYKQLFTALGRSPEDADAAAQRLKEQFAVARAIASR